MAELALDTVAVGEGGLEALPEVGQRRGNPGFEMPQRYDTVTRAARDGAAGAALVLAMHVLITGSSGLIGSALVPLLTAAGHQVTRLVRAVPPPHAEPWVRWDPAAGTIDMDGLERGGADAVVHLAGENLAAGRWTPARKARIRDSRVLSTRLLSEALTKLTRPPRVLVCASGIGYYGDRGAEMLTEDSPPGTGFLADVCRQWEAAAERAKQRGIRIVHVRTGIALTPAGGALAKMLLPFQLGLGGTFGTGSQYMSWIAFDDLLGAYVYALTTDALSGPVNAAAPNPATNLEFTQTLGRVLSRPALLAIPGFVLRLVVGELADEGLLSSQRVTPALLLASGYQFRYPELEGALRHVLGRPGKSR